MPNQEKVENQVKGENNTAASANIPTTNGKERRKEDRQGEKRRNDRGNRPQKQGNAPRPADNKQQPGQQPEVRAQQQQPEGKNKETLPVRPTTNNNLTSRKHVPSNSSRKEAADNLTVHAGRYEKQQ